MNLTIDGYRYEEIHNLDDLVKYTKEGAYVEFSCCGKGDALTEALQKVGFSVEYDHYTDPVRGGTSCNGWTHVDKGMASSIMSLSERKHYPGELWRAVFPWDAGELPHNEEELFRYLEYYGL